MSSTSFTSATNSTGVSATHNSYPQNSNPHSQQLLWALGFGNFVVGCGVMVVPASLAPLSADLAVSVPVAGQLISAAALVMGIGAPLTAALLWRIDRRWLLAFAMVWYALFHVLCALMPSYAALLPMRMLGVIPAAIFTPQAAATLGQMIPPERRAKAVTSIFLGWSVASVLGVPMLSWVAGIGSWRMAFVLVACISTVAALWTCRVLPRGLYVPPLGLAAWRQVLGHRVTMLTVLVTLLSAFGQFTLFAYFSPYFFQVLKASTTQVSLLFLWFGFFGLVGNVLLSRYVTRIGADRAPIVALALMAVSLLMWPLANGMALALLVLLPWGLGCFAGNSAQQARLIQLEPQHAGASVSLNSSAIYAGQALGAALGGSLIAAGGMANLHVYALALVLLALMGSVVSRRL